VFSHYFGKLIVQIYCKLQQKKIKTRLVFDKNERLYVYVVIRLTGYRRIVFYSTCSKCPPFACMHAPCTKTLAPLVNCIVNDDLVDVTPHFLQTMFQFVSVVHPRLVHSLLGDAPDPVINRIKVTAVRWPKFRWNERRRCSRSRTVSRVRVLGRCPV